MVKFSGLCRRFILGAFILLGVQFLGVQSARAQNFVYKLDFDFYFDNLEGSDPWYPTRTLFSVKLAPEVGLQMGRKHAFMVGANLIQDLGDSTFLTKADYTIYYRYLDHNFSALAGAFPRSYSIARYPKSFFREDWNFYNSNIDGLMLQYRNNRRTGYVEFFVDWYGQSQKYRIDEFMLTASSEYSFLNKALFVGANGLLNHYKNDYKLQDSYLLERAFYNVYVGTDLSFVLPFFDEARIGFGTLSSMEHKRHLEFETEWQNNIGWQADLSLKWKGLGLSNSFYFGDSQMIYFQQYGNDMYFGSPFYQSKRYNRTDLSYEWKKSFFSVKADVAIHVTPGYVANQEMLTLKVNLHQMLVKGKLRDIKPRL